MNAFNEQAKDVVETSLKRFSESVQRILNLFFFFDEKR